MPLSSERLAQCRHMHRQNAFFDTGIRPDDVQQFALADQTARPDEPERRADPVLSGAREMTSSDFRKRRSLTSTVNSPNL